MARPVAVLVLLASLLQCCGLGSEDVPFNVKVTNDTSHAVVEQTDEDASYSTVLTPGQSFLDPEYTNEGVQPDRMTSPQGETLGCLPFQFTETPSHTLKVRTSQLVKCKRWAVGANISHDWPDSRY